MIAAEQGRAPRVVLVGTLDTKAAEYGLLRQELERAGLDVLLVDVGVQGAPGISPDVSREEVARVAGADVERLAARGDRGAAVAAMARGAAETLRRSLERGGVDGVLVAGGSNAGTTFAALAPVLPFGVPKVLLATVVVGDTRPYVGDSDVTMINPVVDIAGLNSLSRQSLLNAAGALAGMVAARAGARRPATGREIVAATMFGVTTPGVTALRERLEQHGYEVLVFHANGAGGSAMEHLVRKGVVAGVADLTTTEVADDVVGGVCSAGAERLTAAAQAGIPQVVSLGALDMVNFGPPETVPERFAGRRLYAHNDKVTLMRTNVSEAASIGARMARALASAQPGMARVVVPEGGISAISTPGEFFADRDADRALVEALRNGLPPAVPVVMHPEHINAIEFAHDVADSLHTLLATRRAGDTSTERKP